MPTNASRTACCPATTDRVAERLPLHPLGVARFASPRIARMLVRSTLVLCLLVIGPVALMGQEPPQPRLGINLAGPADWSTELPFVDAFHLSRQWISQRPGQPWGQGPPLQLDERGWIQRLEPECFAETPLCTIDGGHYPSGEWTILWKGEGQVELSKGRVLASEPGRLRVQIEAAGGGFFLRLRATNPANPVRDIQALMPGVSAEEASANPWRARFLERWRGVACLRFMDFQETNNSTQQQWRDRPQPGDATWTRAGIPIEWLCDLANRLDADPWFCLPHRADDEYVREFARLVRQRLAPQRRVYLEYSNEVWNGQFQQHRYAAEQGQALGFAEKSWEAAWRYTAHRSREIFALWEQEWGGRSRLVRVLPSQAANAYVASQIAGWHDAGRHADVLAIAPYVSLNVPPQGKTLNAAPLNAAEVSQWSVERLLDHVDSQSLPESIRWMAANRQVAEQYGLKLVCYEAGQHLVGVQGAESNEALTRLLHAANSHPRMRDIYRRYYAAWEAAGGDLLCHFSSVSRWSKWGSWGLLQFDDDDPRQSPKFEATIEWARQRGQQMTLPQTP